MIKTFKHAIDGIVWAFKHERNMKIHGFAAILVCGLGGYFRINKTDWVILLICIGLVFSAELFNTAIEKIMDVIHPENNEKVKVIKDVSAGAVLVVSIAAAIVGVILFWQYLS